MNHGSWRGLLVARFSLISGIVLSPAWVLFAVVLIFSSPTFCKGQLLNSGTADPLAQSALALLLGDLQQEIVNGSNPLPSPNPNNYPVVYESTSNTYMVPVRSGVPASWSTTGLANTTLLRISGTGVIPFPGIDQTASNALSTGTSANGRSIGPALWNQHYLIQLQNSSTPSDTTPDINFTPPSWVYMTGTGSPAVLTTPTSSVVGRYAYAVYDEGALLDVNVAGFPCDASIYGAQPSTSGVMPSPYVSKGSIAFADLTALSPATAPIQPGVNDLVGWRNYASMQPGGIFPYLTFSGTSVPLIYRNLITSNTNGFLIPADVPLFHGQRDKLFASRQALINLVKTIGTANFNPNALQYLSTFSRAVTAPSWCPSADSTNLPGYVGGAGTSPILYNTNAEQPTVSGSGNPNRDVPNVRFAQTGSVTHWSDGVMTDGGTMITPPTSGTYAVNAGDPLIQSRFSLAKIAWLSQTWAGEHDPGTTSLAYAGSVYPAAIQSCFGLAWGAMGAANGGNSCWSYLIPVQQMAGASRLHLISFMTQVGGWPMMVGCRAISTWTGW